MDELIEKLIFIDTLEKRIEESDQGTTITEEELKSEMGKWFKSAKSDLKEIYEFIAFDSPRYAPLQIERTLTINICTI